MKKQPTRRSSRSKKMVVAAAASLVVFVPAGMASATEPTKLNGLLSGNGKSLDLAKLQASLAEVQSLLDQLDAQMGSGGTSTASNTAKKATVKPKATSTATKKSTTVKKATTPQPVVPVQKAPAPKTTPAPVVKPPTTPKPTTTMKPTTTTSTTAKPAGPKTYTGTSKNEYGNVTVQITVANDKLTAVKITDYPKDSTSGLINKDVVGQLESRALSAQGADFSGDGISGATDTVESFKDSLKQAMSAAKLK